MTLDEFIVLLQTADAQIDADGARLLIATMDDVLLPYAQAIAHRVTGNMADSMHRLGPFSIGQGAIEAHIESGAWYAEEEVARGGDHDWAGRTIADQQAAIQALTDAFGAQAVIVLTGGH